MKDKDVKEMLKENFKHEDASQQTHQKASIHSIVRIIKKSTSGKEKYNVSIRNIVNCLIAMLVGWSDG